MWYGYQERMDQVCTQSLLFTHKLEVQTLIPIQYNGT